MRRMLRQFPASPIQDLFRYAPRLCDYPRPALREQLSSALWICQRCYHHKQRASASGRGLHARQQEDCRRTRAPEFALFNPRGRTLSTGSGNAGDKPRSDLPSQEEGRRSHISKRFSHVMDHLQSNIFIAGQRLNDLTGYSGIEALKKDIEQQGPSSLRPRVLPKLTSPKSFKSKPPERPCKRQNQTTP